MKKFWLILGLALVLVTWGGQGYLGFGTSPAHGQYVYPPPPANPYGYCNPGDPYCYYDYYSAPYADPTSQFFYYVVPKVFGNEEQEERQERREYRQRGRYERGEHGGYRH